MIDSHREGQGTYETVEEEAQIQPSGEFGAFLLAAAGTRMRKLDLNG